MDLTYSGEDNAYRQHVRAWFEEHTPRQPLTTMAERKAWQKTMYQAGYVGMAWPKEFGGWEATPMQQAIVGEEMARVNAPPAVNGLGLNIVGPTLIHHGTVEQKQRYIQNILTADEIWCQLFSEPGSGSDLASLRTRADIRDGHFVVNGQKVWTSLGYAADWGVLLARTDANVPKYNGISYILLDMHSPGVEVRPLKQITGSAEFCEVFFTDVRAPRENLIGQLNQGWQIAQTTLSYERGGSLLGRVVRAQVLFAQLVKTVKRMEEQGVLADHDPLVRQKLGRICVDMEVLRYNGLRILSRHQKGNRPGPESSIDKLYRSEFDQRFQALAQEILGPYGQLSDGLPPEFVDDGDDQRRVETWAFRFLASKAGTIAAGTSEVQRNIIGERVLGLPKEPRADRVKK